MKSNFHTISNLNQFSLLLEEKELSLLQREQFNAFLETLQNETIVYRGISQEALKGQYKIGIDQINLLSEYIFCVGCKGKTYYENKCKNYESVNVEDITDVVISRLFDKLKQVCYGEYSSENTMQYIGKFRFNNCELIEYFARTSKAEWLATFKQLDVKSQRIAKDYYTLFLHTIGLAGFGRTYALSTTTSFKESFRYMQDGIIIIGWTSMKMTESSKSLKSKFRRLKSSLPEFHGRVFPEQQEVTLKCGLLPHYIIGYLHNNNFFINPAIFSSIDEKDSIPQNGLPVDQIDFQKLIRKANYKKYCMMEECFYFDVSL